MIELGLKFFKWLRVVFFYAGLYIKDKLVAHQLASIQNNLHRIGRRDILLISRLPKSSSNVEFYINYYRKIGVKHFIFVAMADEEYSTFLTMQNDVSIWRVNRSKNSAFDVRWYNILLYRFGRERWSLIVEPDEYFVYPNMATRSLAALGSFLDEERRRCVHTIVLDAYHDHAQKNAIPDEQQNPFVKFPMIDAGTYLQFPTKRHSIHIKGGPRLRTDFFENPQKSPNLNRITFVKWKRIFHFDATTQQAWPISLNRPHALGKVSVSGALISFNWIKSKLDQNPENIKLNSAFEEGVSTPYKSPEQLIDLGLICAGEWF